MGQIKYNEAFKNGTYENVGGKTANLTTAPVIDLSTGGQNGYLPRRLEFVSSASFVQGNVIDRKSVV